MLGKSETAAIKAIIKALNVPRDRLGRLNGTLNAAEDMRLFALKYKIPHGGRDSVDQAVMILQRMIGEKPTSIMD